MRKDTHPAGSMQDNSRKKIETMSSAADLSPAELPWSLYGSFAKLVGFPLKICGVNGHPLEGVQQLPVSGPCEALRRGGLFSEQCARNHAEAAAMAIELQRPYIYNCHMRLAAWAIPIIREGQALPVVIICGGVLLTEPDMALIRHLERQAIANGADPALLARSLRMVPVISRSKFREAAEYLFEMSDALLTSRAMKEPGGQTAPPPPPAASVVFPPRQKKESRRAKLRNAEELTRQNLEIEAIRCLRDRKPDDARRILLEILHRELRSAPASGAAANLILAEIFARLFRKLTHEKRISRLVHDKQARFLKEVISQNAAENILDDFKRLCKKFVSIAEESAGEGRSRQVKAIQNYIEKNLGKKLTLQTVGRKFGLPEKALNDVIRRACGMSFTDYVASLRVFEAKHLLSTTNLGIGDIAHRTGFPDQSYFTKVFKSQLGVTPTEFRHGSE